MRSILGGTVATLAALAAFGSGPASAAGCASPPSVSTSPATGVSASAATLHGSVNPNGCPASWSFRYGPTTSYGSATVTHSTGSGASSSPVAVRITGLAPNAVYHFGIVATNAAGTTDGSDQTFQTGVNCGPGGPLPSVAVTSVTRVSASAATLRATVNPNGCTTQYSFEYGSTAGYGSATPSVGVGSGTSSKAVAGRITALRPHATYHVRILATNAAGTAYGPDQTFETSVNCTRGGPLPLVTRTRATNATQSSVRLRATVNPNGCTAAYRFVYGKTSAQGHRTPIVHVGSGTSPIIASEELGSLNPNTSYHVRLIAYSATGKVIGPDLKFKTKLGPVVRIAPGTAYLDKPFVAGIKLSCVHGRIGCNGHVKIYWARQIIGQHRFFLRLGQTGVILVGLDGVGRALFRSHQTVRVAVLAHLKYYDATRTLTLVRAFTAPGG